MCGVCIRVCVITQVFPFLTKCFSCVDTILNLTRCCLFLCFWLFWLCVFIFKYVLYIRTLQLIHSIENRQWPSFTSSVLTRSVPKLHIQMLHNKSLPHQYFCTEVCSRNQFRNASDPMYEQMMKAYLCCLVYMFFLLFVNIALPINHKP